jgi:hypothetical protein
MGKAGGYGGEDLINIINRRSTLKGWVKFPAFVLIITYVLQHKVSILTFPI